MTGFNAEKIFFGVSKEEASSMKPEHYRIKIEVSDYKVGISASCDYQNMLCGMLGNFNGDMNDDWVNNETGEVMIRPEGPRTPSNTPLWDATWEFGNSWLIPELESCEKDDDRDTEGMCTEDDLPEIEEKCAAFNNQPFDSCDNERENAYTACVYSSFKNFGPASFIGQF